MLAAIPLLSGCSADSLSPESIAKASEATVATGGMKIAIEQSFTVADAGRLTMRGDGVLDVGGRTSQLTLKLSDAPDLPASMHGDDFTTEIVTDRFVVYIRSPQLQGLSGAKKWLKFDLAELGKEAGIDFSALTQSGQDPTQALHQLKAASGDIEKVGEEDVRGVSTTRYRATIDLRRYPELVPAADRAAARASTEQIIKLGGVSTVPVDVWIDSDDIVRRVKQDLKVPIEGGLTIMRQQFEFYDFGAEVDVELPAEDEVVDVTELAAEGVAAMSP